MSINEEIREKYFSEKGTENYKYLLVCYQALADTKQ